MTPSADALMGSAPMDPAEEATASPAGMQPADDTMEEEPEDAGGPVVLCTIMDNGDGTFQLIKGDEEDGGEEDGMSGEAAEGMPPAAGGVAARPAGESFDSPGPLLKAVLDMLKEAEDRNGGSAQENFNAGFNANTEAKPKAM